MDMERIHIYESDDAGSITKLEYAFVDSRFGEVLTACDDIGLCFAGFVTDGRGRALDELRTRFPHAELAENANAAADVFGETGSIHIAGSRFRRNIWKTLLKVGKGSTVTYAQLAAMAGVPRAVRAAASAVAGNPISVVVPCHRVVRSDGTTGQYYWGADLKRRLLEYEKSDVL